MKVISSIPKDITAILNKSPQIGRRELAYQCDISESMARNYTWLFKNSRSIYHYELNPPKSGKTKRAGLLPDIHFPYHDQAALDCAVDYLVKIGIDTLVLTGDGVDCYWISYWKSDPMRPIFAKEVEITKPMIAKLSSYFPDTEKVWMLGNHEDRLRRLLQGESRKLAGLKALTIPEIFELESYGFKWVSNRDLLRSGLKPFSIGKLFILHGDEVRISGGAVNFAKLHYDKNPVTQVNSHHHSTQEYIVRKMDLKVDGSWVMGCLCDLNPEYAPSNRWNHGFGVVEWDADGYFSFENKKILDGKVL